MAFIVGGSKDMNEHVVKSYCDWLGEHDGKQEANEALILVFTADPSYVKMI